MFPLIIVIGVIIIVFNLRGIRKESQTFNAILNKENIEIKEKRPPDEPNEAQIKTILDAEGEKILSSIPQGAYKIALCVEGKQKSSEELAKTIQDITLNGKSSFVFIIGSSFGLSPEIKKLSDSKLSFSPMTFPHQLMRVMLLEQIYRAFQINTNGKYHK